MNIKFIRSKMISVGLITASIMTVFANVTNVKAQTNFPYVPGPFTAPASPLVEPNFLGRIRQSSRTNAPLLRRGSRGQAVRDVQIFLRQQGFYRGAIDGIYGSQTSAAVRAFQRRYNNLSNDGIVGRNTWSTMFGSIS